MNTIVNTLLYQSFFNNILFHQHPYTSTHTSTAYMNTYTLLELCVYLIHTQARTHTHTHRHLSLIYSGACYCITLCPVSTSGGGMQQPPIPPQHPSSQSAWGSTLASPSPAGRKRQNQWRQQKDVMQEMCVQGKIKEKDESQD